MIEPTPTQVELRERIYWLIRLRWLAACGAALVIFAAQQLGYALPYPKLYGVAALILLINVAHCLVHPRLCQRDEALPAAAAPWCANVQISLDLVCLTLLLHLAGGAENPFTLFYLFHMVIASVLLSVRSAYAQATFASALFWAMVLLEHSGRLPHHCLGILTAADAHTRAFPLVTAAALTATLFLAVYFATAIARRLRQREQEVGRLLGDLRTRTDELQAVNAALQEAQRAQALYLRKVAHELKAPLAATQSALKALRHTMLADLPKRHARMLSRAEGRLDGLLDLVHKLLLLAQTSEAALVGRQERVDLRQIIREAAALLRNRATDKQVALHLELDDALPPLLAEPESIEAMVTNLVSNAVRYTPAGGHVWVRASRHNGDILLEVQDTGIGIPSVDQPRIFEEFFRTAAARGFTGAGSGLGLAIVKNVVESVGGTIELDSEVNRGSTFRVLLPVRAPEDATGQSPS